MPLAIKLRSEFMYSKSVPRTRAYSWRGKSQKQEKESYGKTH